MKTNYKLTSLLYALLMCAGGIALQAQVIPPESGELVDLATADASAFKCENGATATIEDVAGAKALQLAFAASNSYPGVDLPHAGGQFDLTGYTGIVVTVTNNTSAQVGVGLRVDNPGDWQKSPWNSEVGYVSPGQTKTIALTFGKSYGKPGYELDPSHVKNIKIMVIQPKVEGNIVMSSIKAIK